jgi:F0F1-type ATP synthase membrane subunit b/b'
MSPALANFLFELVNVLTLAGLLGWLFFRPVRAHLDAERAERTAAQDELTEATAAAGRARAEAEAALAAARAEAERQRAELLAHARQEGLRVAAEARDREAEAARRSALEAEARRKAELVVMAGEVGRLAGASVEALLAALHGPDLDLALVRAACARLAALPADARRAAVVEAARPLSEEAQVLLTSSLGARPAPRLCPSLGAGIRVTTPAGQIDATAAALAREAATATAAELKHG